MKKKIVAPRIPEHNEEEWGKLLDKVQALHFEQSQAADLYERKRVDNIRQRFGLLKQALTLGYAYDQTLRYIAELGAEFGENKPYPYSGTSIFLGNEKS